MMLSKEEIADLYIGANEAVNGLSRNNDSFILAFRDHFKKLHDLEAKLKVAVELVRKGFKFSGHFDDCEQEHDDEPCTCGADEFEHQAHIFLSENDEIKAK